MTVTVTVTVVVADRCPPNPRSLKLANVEKAAIERAEAAQADDLDALGPAVRAAARRLLGIDAAAPPRCQPSRTPSEPNPTGQ